VLRSIAILLAALAFTSLCAASDSVRTASAVYHDSLQIFAHKTPARSPEFLASLGLTQPTAAVAQQACCKICSVGKACGNACISRDKICHVGPGCACDG
jgi:hypothetical protein